MPRGFLVKRTKKTGPISYRVRPAEQEDEVAPQTFIASTWASCPDTLDGRSTGPVPASVPQSLLRSHFVITSSSSQVKSVKSRPYHAGMPEALCAPSLSPNRPVSTGYNESSEAALGYLDRKRNSRSPIQAESFPESTSSSFTSLVDAQMALMPSLAEIANKMGSICSRALSPSGAQNLKRPAVAPSKAKQPLPKKPKMTCAPNSAEKKMSFKDEVTTSPVLGLRIKEDPEEDCKPRASAGSPLGEFICQLCKERYSDPLSLAQHKCSRIVRVEYRCTECDKVFSCPANLASHRRWHKPRGAQTDADRQTLENITPALVNKVRETNSPSPHSSDAGSDEESYFDCPLCCKKFRRQAYLRKHLALHSRPSATAQKAQQATTAESSPGKKAPQPQASRPIHVIASLAPIYRGADATLPPAPTRVAPEELTVRHGEEIFRCRYCSEKFFSSPGLTRHINRYHSPESRHAILLSQAVL
ncbi:insulinoma-associated protein 1a-like [Polypterus senegalus]|nr:insulinoma-associated protein 1a-like [Polypterus senegalus]